MDEVSGEKRPKYWRKKNTVGSYSVSIEALSCWWAELQLSRAAGMGWPVGQGKEAEASFHSKEPAIPQTLLS